MPAYRGGVKRILKLLEYFKSLRLAVWLMAGVILFLFAGSIVMPARPDAYGGINSGLLFDWLWSEAGNPLHFWFWAVLIILCFLTFNTIVCSVDSVVRKLSRAEFWLRISPQFMHLGFLLILLAHLLSSGWGFKVEGNLPEGRAALLPDGSTLRVYNVKVESYPSGMPKSWMAEVDVRGKEGGGTVTGRLGPNRPAFFDGVGVYLKSVNMSRFGMAVHLVAARDPGALWALIGAVLFTLGNLVFLGLRIRAGN